MTGRRRQRQAPLIVPVGAGREAKREVHVFKTNISPTMFAASKDRFTGKTEASL